jgi:hypothetical protein
MTQLRSLNKELKAEQLPLELIKGDGYFYFLYETHDEFATRSVYVDKLNHLPIEMWMEEAREFYDDVKNMCTNS